MEEFLCGGLLSFATQLKGIPFWYLDMYVTEDQGRGDTRDYESAVYRNGHGLVEKLIVGCLNSMRVVCFVFPRGEHSISVGRDLWCLVLPCYHTKDLGLVEFSPCPSCDSYDLI